MSILIFIAVLALLVLSHELGHFFVAKRSGVEVKEFGIGFPPRIFSFFYHGTRYSLNLIPLGGFVRMQEYKDPEKPGTSFEEKSLLARFFIVSAGICMNILLALILIISGYMVGFPQKIDGEIPGAIIKNRELVIVSVLPESPAEKQNMLTGDRILSLNGEEIHNVETFIQYIRAQKEKPVQIKYIHDGAIQVKEIQPVLLQEIGEYGLGIGLVEIGKVSYAPHRAVLEGTRTTFFFLGEIFRSLGNIIVDLFKGQSPGVDVSGPVGIALMTKGVVDLGFLHLMQFVALLSLNLAVINFFPFPALDGGRAIFLVIERLRGRAVSGRIESLVHNIGFIFLLLLVVVITFHDLIGLNLFGRL